jgi:hypothetical protein
VDVLYSRTGSGDAPQLCLTFGVYATISHLHCNEIGLGQRYDGLDFALMSLDAGRNLDPLTDHLERRPAAPDCQS